MHAFADLNHWAKYLVIAIFLGLLAALPAPAYAVTPGGSGCELTGVNSPSSPGSQSNPYAISDPTELAEVADCDTSTSKYFELTNDIDLQGVAWKPIGAGNLPNDSAASPFKGHFDGAGHTITNLVTNSGYSGGLFGAIAGNSVSDMSSVKNLRIQGAVYSGVFGLENKATSFSNITLNVDVSRNPSATSRTKIGGFAMDGFLIQASSISLEASGTFGLRGIVGDSSVTEVGGLYASLDSFYSDPAPNVFSKLRITTFIGGLKPSVDLAGVANRANHKNEISDSQVNATFESFQSGTTYQIPDVGGMVGTNSSTDALTISNSVVRALIVLPYSSFSPYIDGSFGGFVGNGRADLNSVSAVIHAHIPPNVNFGNNGFIGGLFGVASGTSGINDSYASLTVTHEGSNISSIKFGGLAGYLSSGATIAGAGNFFNGSSSPVVSASIGEASAGTSTLTATKIGWEEIVPATFISAGWDMNASSASFNSSTGWNICEHPFPTVLGESNCEPVFLGGKVSRSGLGVELFFGSPINTGTLPAQSAFQIKANETSIQIDAPVPSSFGSSNSIAISFSNQSEFDSGVLISGSYLQPQSGSILESIASRAVGSFPQVRFANSSNLVPPTAAISLVSAGTTTASLQVTCAAECGGGTNFTYSIAVEKAGTGVADVTTQDSGLITGLSPSTSYTAKATVTFNGRTSAEVALNFNTLRPTATLSGVVVNGQEITGNVSCLNCGADPTSFSLIATPSGGGQVLTSSTAVISGLATGTTYSVSAVLTFLGAESLEVTWSVAVTTAIDPMPSIASITPNSGLTTGGTQVTLIGTNFTGASVAIDGQNVTPIDVVSSTEIRFATPANSAGSVVLRVTNSGGYAETSFTFTAPPVTSGSSGGGLIVALNTPEITTFSTRQLTTVGGQITAEGRRLADISLMTLGGIKVTILSNTDTAVTFTVLEMPVGTWDLRLVGANGTLIFQQAITITGEKLDVQSTPGTLLGYTMTLRFTGNSRTLNVVQERNLAGKLGSFSTAETIICWGYTTAANPNAWAIAHATARAKAACDFAIGGDSSLKSVVRLRYGVSKEFAMRAAIQFWK